MEDQRGTEIRVGDTVIFANLRTHDRYTAHTMGYGEVFKMTEKMVFVKDRTRQDKHIQKAPHNVIVANPVSR